MKYEYVIVAILATIFCIWYASHFFSSSEVSARANGIVAVCASEKKHTQCYEREVPALYPKLTIGQLFDITREIRRLDPTYQFCHVLAHKVGERVVAGDPSKWIEAVAENPKDGLCSNGYIHGVIGGRFRAEVLDENTLKTLIPDFSRACEPRQGWSPSLLDEAICYHGMGHLYMFITDAKILKALSLCEETAMSPTGDFRRVCREGVFMQIYQPLEPDDFLLIEQMPIKPTKATVRQFCASFERDAYEGACLRESWPYFRQEILNGSGIEKFCSGQPSTDEETACYESAFSILGRQTLGNRGQALSGCSKVPEERKDACYSRAALTILDESREEFPEAIAFCKQAPGTYGQGCLRFLVDISAFIFGNDALLWGRFCAAIPVTLQSLCRADPRSLQVPKIPFVYEL